MIDIIKDFQVDHTKFYGERYSGSVYIYADVGEVGGYWNTYGKEISSIELTDEIHEEVQNAIMFLEKECQHEDFDVAWVCIQSMTMEHEVGRCKNGKFVYGWASAPSNPNPDRG